MLMEQTPISVGFGHTAAEWKEVARDHSWESADGTVGEDSPGLEWRHIKFQIYSIHTKWDYEW